MTGSDTQTHVADEATSHLRPADWAPDSAVYGFTVKGCLDNSWSDWFDGLVITTDCDRGETTLVGTVADQTALHGLLNKVRNLGLTLLWLNRLDHGIKAGASHCDEEQTHGERQ